MARPCTAGKTNPTLSFFFFLFLSSCSDFKPVMFSRAERVSGRGRVGDVFLKRCMLEMCLVCVCVWNVLESFDSLNKPMWISPPASPQGLKSCPGFCQNPPNYRIRNFKKKNNNWFFLMNAIISWFKNNSSANWLDLVFLDPFFLVVFQQPDIIDCFCYWPDQNETTS